MSYRKKFYILLVTSLVAFGVLSFLLYTAQKLIFLTDISTKPLDPLANLDLNPQVAAGRPPVYLVSYADGHEVFFRNQYALAQSALGRGVDVIMNYRRSMLDPQFVEKNKLTLNQKQGAGYWLWKPWIILDAMKRAPENAVIIYCDVGFTIRGSLMPLIDLTKQYSILLAYYEDTKVYGVANKAVKREVFLRLDCDEPKCHNGPTLLGGFLVVKNNKESRTFIETWLHYMLDPSLLIQGPSSQPELPEFKNHLHDLAILSVLYSRDPKGKYLIPYDSSLHKDFLIWRHRKPFAHDPSYIYESLLPDIRYIRMSKIERKFYNASWLKWIREKIFKSQAHPN